VLRAPRSSTHILVTPLEKIEGIESPSLLATQAGAYWRAALTARHFVQEAGPRDLPLSAVGLAINSELTRSQDHLHIHAECFKPRILASVRAYASRAGDRWHEFPDSLDRSRFYVRRIKKETLMAGGNLFATLADLPGAPRGLSGVTAAVLSLGRTDEELIVLGSRTRTRTVEGLFQSDCLFGASRDWEKVRPGLAADNAR
jgi:CDP-diacylglycerol pyrophosphatase